MKVNNAICRIALFVWCYQLSRFAATEGLLRESKRRAGSWLSASAGGENPPPEVSANRAKLKQYILAAQETVPKYHTSFRRGGIEGKIGDAPYSTPESLQQETRRLTDVITSALKENQLAMFASRISQLQDRVVPLATVRTWAKNVAWIHVVGELLEKGCDMHIDNTIISAFSLEKEFPDCLLEYVNRLPNEAKRGIGLTILHALTDTKVVQDVFHPTRGFCPSVVALLSIKDVTFCRVLHDVLTSVKSFIIISAHVQNWEKAHYGPSLSMVQITLPRNRETEGISRRSLDTITERTLTDEEHEKIKKLRYSIAAKKLFKKFLYDVSATEAQHLVKNWYNDPVHKWRYAVGLFQSISIVGFWLTNEAASVAMAT